MRMIWRRRWRRRRRRTIFSARWRKSVRFFPVYKRSRFAARRGCGVGAASVSASRSTLMKVDSDSRRPRGRRICRVKRRRRRRRRNVRSLFVAVGMFPAGRRFSRCCRIRDNRRSRRGPRDAADEDGDDDAEHKARHQPSLLVSLNFPADSLVRLGVAS